MKISIYGAGNQKLYLEKLKVPEKFGGESPYGGAGMAIEFAKAGYDVVLAEPNKNIMSEDLWKKVEDAGVKVVSDDIEAAKHGEVHILFTPFGKITINIDGKEFEILKDYVEIKKVKKVIKGEKVIPHVIEPSYGIDRITYCLLEHSYREEEDRVYLDLKPSIAPIKAYVLPLVNREDMPKIAKEIEQMLRENGIIAEYDDSGAIGRRYMRADEIGVPFCITVDGQTLKDRTVTIRERNTREQVRVKIDELVDYLKEKLKD